MDLSHFGSYCAANVALFVWIQWMRTNRLARVVGSIVIVVGIAPVLPWAIQHVSVR